MEIIWFLYIIAFTILCNIVIGVLIRNYKLKTKSLVSLIGITLMFVMAYYYPLIKDFFLGV